MNGFLLLEALLKRLILAQLTLVLLFPFFARELQVRLTLLQPMAQLFLVVERLSHGVEFFQQAARVVRVVGEMRQTRTDLVQHVVLVLEQHRQFVRLPDDVRCLLHGFGGVRLNLRLLVLDEEVPLGEKTEVNLRSVVCSSATNVSAAANRRRSSGRFCSL